MKNFYVDVVKRVLDILLSLIALILLSPILIVTAILVRIKLGTPIFFSQDRPGKDGKIFKMYKFRTMTNKVGNDGNLLSDEQRMTSFGKKLRSTSLDELPELWNILKGDMSFIGPRPLLVEYLSLYSDFQNRRHEVRPGLTGWAQVNGRNTTLWKERFRLDVYYVERVSLIFDIQILLLTVITVLTKEGISSGDSVTMEKFKGNSEDE